MDYKTYLIGDGVRLSHIRTDRFKKARLSVTLATPLSGELSPENSLIIPAAFAGTAKYKDFRAVCCRAEELYAADISDINQKLGNCQLVGLVASMLNDEYITDSDRAAGFSILSGVFELFSEILTKPRFRKADLETEKANQINRIKSIQNDAFGFAKYRFTREMFADEACGYPLAGEVAQVEKITAASLKKRHAELLDRSAVEFFYCGTASAEKIIGLIVKSFPDLGKNPTALPTVEPKTPGSVRTIEESGEYRQGNLLIGLRTPAVLSDREFYAVELMNQIYGDGATSKLFMNVREKKSLCYFCGSSYDEVRGVISVGCGIDNADYAAAKAAIFEQLDEIRAGNITDTELENAREALENDCRAAEDNPCDYEDFGRTARFYGGPTTIEEYREGVIRVTKTEIVDAAQKIQPDTVYFLCGTLTEDDADE